jgi:hypothetical protein
MQCADAPARAHAQCVLLFGCSLTIRKKQGESGTQAGLWVRDCIPGLRKVVRDSGQARPVTPTGSDAPLRRATGA